MRRGEYDCRRMILVVLKFYENYSSFEKKFEFLLRKIVFKVVSFANRTIFWDGVSIIIVNDTSSFKILLEL